MTSYPNRLRWIGDLQSRRSGGRDGLTREVALDHVDQTLAAVAATGARVAGLADRVLGVRAGTDAVADLVVLDSVADAGVHPETSGNLGSANKGMPNLPWAPVLRQHPNGPVTSGPSA